METKLYYTKQELFNEPHTKYIETETNIMFTNKDERFSYYKKLYLVRPNEDVKEIYVDICQYCFIKDYLLTAMTRYIKEFEGYVFWSITDYLTAIEFANKNRLF